MASFTDILSLIANGEKVDAANANRPLLELLYNTQYLRDLLAASSSSTALYVRQAALESAVQVGQPVYYNTATSKYERAQADGTAKQNMVGLVYSKHSATLGDIITLGYATLSLTAALNGAGLAAGRYYLSASNAGVIVSGSPTPSILTLISDGAGNVFVLPVMNLVGPQGVQGPTGAGVVAGMIMGYGGATVPSGWLECDGAAVSRTTYADLFAAISTTWGVGDGSTTFNLPDLRGRDMIGAGTGAGLTARTLGQSGGAETHPLVVAELPVHSHNLVDHAGVSLGTGTSGGMNRVAVVANANTPQWKTADTGSGTAHQNMQPFRVVKFAIKT